jgi:hypothetical protein
MLLFQSQWLPVTHPVGAPVRPTNTVSTQTVGLFYPSEKGLSNKREEIDKKVALEQSMRDRQPLMTPVSPGKGLFYFLYNYRSTLRTKIHGTFFQHLYLKCY